MSFVVLLRIIMHVFGTQQQICGDSERQTQKPKVSLKNQVSVMPQFFMTDPIIFNMGNKFLVPP